MRGPLLAAAIAAEIDPERTFAAGVGWYTLAPPLRGQDMQFGIPVAIAAALSVFACNSEAASRSQVTDYCLVEPVEGFTGKESLPLGNFEMEARLTIAGGHYVLKAWNVMPDNSQILEIEADGTYNHKGMTHIRFIDNFGNRGRGTFKAAKAEMQIDVDVVKAADDPMGRNIGRNYGSYKLYSRGCKWIPE